MNDTQYTTEDFSPIILNRSIILYRHHWVHDPPMLCWCRTLDPILYTDLEYFFRVHAYASPKYYVVRAICKRTFAMRAWEYWADWYIHYRNSVYLSNISYTLLIVWDENYPLLWFLNVSYLTYSLCKISLNQSWPGIKYQELIIPHIKITQINHLVQQYIYIYY